MANSTLAEANLNDLTRAEERALSLLGQGVIPEQAAAASGLSPSRISQLLSQDQFAARVAELRFENLSKHNERDSAYDDLEDALIDKMRDCLPLMVRPGEVLKAIQVINQAKRRGSSAPNSINEQTTIVNLILPTQILSQFQINADNQVVSAGNQPLVTVQSGSLLDSIRKKQENRRVLTKPAEILSDASKSNSGRTISAEDF